ncbi:MAG: tetratricopeptide repeat protein [Verrucomicrobiae bacterium]|nr:tetratricopeptide repeat protein [Verrucomicrobiae bacterium]
MTLEELMEEGTTAVALGELAQAVEHFRKATEIAPEHFEAWHSLGMALMKAERHAEAVEAGLRAVRLNPQDQFARVSLSMCFQRNGQIPEAEAEAAKAKILGWGGKLLPNEPGQPMSKA